MWISVVQGQPDLLRKFNESQGYTENPVPHPHPQNGGWVSTCSPGCTETYNIDQAGFELIEICLSFQVLGLLAWVSTPFAFFQRIAYFMYMSTL